MLRLGALGLSNERIADELKLAVRTVTIYMHRVRKKLGRFDRSQMLGIAIFFGLVSIVDIVQDGYIFLHQRFPNPQLLLPDRDEGFHEGAD